MHGICWIFLLASVLLRAQGTIQLPGSPIAPTDSRQCDLLRREWQAASDQISKVHQQCLDANVKGPSGKGNCSKAACQSLHTEMDNIGKQGSAETSRCDQQVTEYRRQQEAIRQAEEAQRRQQEALVAQQRQAAQRFQDQVAAQQRQQQAQAQTPRQTTPAYQPPASPAYQPPPRASAYPPPVSAPQTVYDPNAGFRNQVARQAVDNFEQRKADFAAQRAANAANAGGRDNNEFQAIIPGNQSVLDTQTTDRQAIAQQVDGALARLNDSRDPTPLPVAALPQEAELRLPPLPEYNRPSPSSDPSATGGERTISARDRSASAVANSPDWDFSPSFAERTQERYQIVRKAWGEDAAVYAKWGLSQTEDGKAAVEAYETYQGAAEGVKKFQEVGDYAVRRYHNETTPEEDARMIKEGVVNGGKHLIGGARGEMFEAAADSYWNNTTSAMNKSMDAIGKFGTDREYEIQDLDFSKLPQSYILDLCKVCASAVKTAQRIERLPWQIRTTANQAVGTVVDGVATAAQRLDATVQYIGGKAIDSWTYLYNRISQ